MSKKNKKQNAMNITNSCPVDLPEIVDMDSLSYYLDEDIRERERALLSEKESVVKSGFDPYAWEIELAYVQREKMIREARRIEHEKYVKNSPEELYFENDLMDHRTTQHNSFIDHGVN